MADHAKPILTDNYTDVLSQIRGRFEDQAKGFDPASTTATNLSTGTIRWNSAEKKFQKWSGTTWGDLTDNYVLSGATFSTGTANGVAYLNGNKVLTTGSALTFDGTNLGVGTAPSYAVDIRNAASTALRVGSNGNAFGSLLSWDNPSGTGRLWTLGAYDFVFGVNSTEQMRLTPTGLGIGTSSPGAKVDVRGASTDIGFRYIESTTGNTNRIQLGAVSGAGYIDVTAGVGLPSLQLRVVGTTQATIDAFGNHGLGVIPSAWGGSYKVFQNPAGAIAAFGTASVAYAQNAYDSGIGAWKYLNDGAAGFYNQSGGTHVWFTAPSGTAGAPINFTQAMTLNASGNLGIGTSSPSQKLQVSGNTLVPIGSSYFSYTSDFGFGTPDFDGLQVFAGGGDNLRFGHRTSGAFTERMRLDANGKLILSAANQGIQFADGTTQTTAAINPATASVGAVGTYAFLRGVQAEPGQTYSGAGLHYTGGVVETNSRPVPAGSIWRAMGYTSVVDRGTLFLRIS